MTTRPVAVRVSAATRLKGSCARQASKIASEIWSAILSGCPSVTDSEVNRKRLVAGKLVSPQGGCLSLLRAFASDLGRLTEPQARSGFCLNVLQNGTRDSL